MTQTYRTDDGARWGTGKGSNLTPAEVDNNFWDVIERIVTLEALPSAAAGIDHFSVSGTQFYVIMSDSTTLGPYDLPMTTFLDRGEWATSTAYSVLDTFTINGGLYVVIFAHTSDPTTFDAGANDGLGHEYYRLMLQTPGSSLPTGGAVGQVLQKSSSSDYAMTWGWKTPTGGTARQYLIQQSGTQDDTAWDTPTAADVEFVPVTDSLLVSDNVADALEELSTSVAGGSTAVADLSDILFATGDPTDGQVLTYDGANWTAETPEPVTDPTITALSTSGSFSFDPIGNIFTITPSGDATLNANSSPAGQTITIIITTSGATSRQVVFNGGFKAQGNITTGTASGKVFTVTFLGNGTTFFELSRTTAM